MMFSPSISWAPSDKISLAFVDRVREGSGQLQEADLVFGPPAVRVQWSLCFSPPVVQIQYHSAVELAILILKHVCDLVYSSVWCVYKHQRERGEKNLHHVVGKCESPTRLLYSYLSAPLPTLQEGEWVRVVFKFFMIWFNEFVGLNSLCFNEVITSGWGCW